MKILVDAQSLQWAVKERGAGKYTISFIKSLIRHGIDVHILINDGEHYDFAYNTCIKLIDRKNIHTFIYDNVTNRDDVVRSINPDVFHILDPLAPDITNPPFVDNDIKCIATVHDLIVYKFKEYRQTVCDEFVDRFASNMLRLEKFDHIIVLTNHVKNDLLSMTSVDESKITVCSSAINNELLDETEVDTNFKNFILYVGGNDYRKNLNVLLDAYELLPEQIKKEYNLVVTTTDSANRNGVISFHATNGELINLYKKAALMVFPSLDEGFGMPLVEAMHFGCPLLCSDTSVSREIVGDIDCYFNQLSVRDLTKKIISLLHNKQLLNTNREYGLNRSKLYNWDNVIFNNIKVYKALIESKTHEN